MNERLPYECMTIDKLMSLGAVMSLREALDLGWEEIAVSHDGKVDSCRLNEDGTYRLGSLSESDLDSKKISLGYSALQNDRGMPTAEATLL